MNKIKQLLMALSFVPNLCVAQTTTENYVKTVTMLDADGIDSIQSVRYYNGLGYPTLSVGTSGTNGSTACILTTYDALGREKRKYLPVPGDNLDYISESNVKSRSYYYQDNSAFV